MKLLTICIPTYNRAKVLDESLTHLMNQLSGNNSKKIEILISDNCSSDNTFEIVRKYTNKGFPILYNRNRENIGADGNFLYCLTHAKGKYIWLLGDDDYLLDGSLDYLIKVMEEDDYGLIHIKESKRHNKNMVYEVRDMNLFRNISHMLTFMSVNIINSNTISGVDNPQQYFKSCFLQVPFYINAAIFPSTKKNLVVYHKILDCGHASSTNGGFNYFMVIVNNYLGIWCKAINSGWIDKKTFKLLKREYFFSFVIGRIYQYLIKKDIDANYDFSNSWMIIFREYGKNAYFYIGFIYIFLKKIAKFIISPFRNNN